MASNRKVEPRLPPIMHAYLEDLMAIGYGKTKAAVAQRFIENAVLDAVEKKVIPQRNTNEFKQIDDD